MFASERSPKKISFHSTSAQISLILGRLRITRFELRPAGEIIQALAKGKTIPRDKPEYKQNANGRGADSKEGS